MKKIIIQEYNSDEFCTDSILSFHEYIKSIFPEDYILITTPFRTYMADPNDKLIYINTRSYSVSEMLEAIEKAEMYDGLCR